MTDKLTDSMSEPVPLAGMSTVVQGTNYEMAVVLVSDDDTQTGMLSQLSREDVHSAITPI